MAARGLPAVHLAPVFCAICEVRLEIQPHGNLGRTASPHAHASASSNDLINQHAAFRCLPCMVAKQGQCGSQSATWLCRTRITDAAAGQPAATGL